MQLKLQKLNFGLGLLAGTFAVSMLVIFLGAHSLVVNREYAVQNARIQSRNLAQSINQNITSIFRRIDSTLFAVIRAMEEDLVAGSLNVSRMTRFLATEEKNLTEAVAIRITDAEGRVILGNPTEDPAASFTDRPYFSCLRDHPGAGMFVTKPIVGKFTKRWVITSARRYNRPDGSFGGVVVVPVFLEHFQGLLSGFDVGAGGMLTLRDSEGGFVVRHPVVVKNKTLPVGDRVISRELQAIINSGVSQETFSAVAPFDQTQRMLTFKKVEGAPFFVVAGQAEEDYLAQWKRDRVITVTIVLLFLAGVWAMAGFLWFSWKRRERDANRLLDNSNRLQSILQTAMDGFWLVDLQGCLLDVNEAYCRMSGYTRQELLGKRISDIEAKETAADTTSHLQKVTTQREDRFGSRHRRKDGTLYDVEVSVQYLPVDGGRFVSFLRDITKRKQAEEKLTVIMKAVESTSDAIGISDAQGHHCYQNRALSELFGYATAEELERAGGGPVVVKDPAVAREMFETIMSGKSWAGELEMVTKSGRVFPAYERADAIKDDEGKLVGLIGLITDITERKRGEDALHLFKDLVEHSSDAIGMSTPEGRHYYQNKAFDRLFGAIGDRPQSVYVDESIGSVVFSTIMGGGSWHGEINMFDKARSVRNIFLRAYAIKDPDGRVLGLVGIHTDVTERRQAEERGKVLQEKLERAARMESLGVLAGGVAHDLNNVLGPLIGLPDMVAEYITRHGDSADPEYVDSVESMRAMKSSAMRAVSVVSDLVVMGRRGQFQMVPVNLNLVLEQMMTSKQIRVLEARCPDVKVSVRLSEEAPWCLGSDSRLMRVFANLVGNAAEAIDGAGDVVVCSGRRVFVESHRGYEDVPAGDYVTVEVADTGCGMDPKTLARIFEPFFSTKAPSERSGSGLGLSVVHGLVKDHAGFLDVKSVPGKGTTFTVYLPAVAAAEVKASLETEPLPGGCERILVVDDEPDQQFLSRRQLKKLGYDVTTVSSGEEALALFEGAGREGKPAPFDLVLMDMIMSGGMDGLNACQAILRVFPAQPLVILSGHAPEKYEDQVKGLGLGWLPKPCRPADLAYTIRAQLDRRA